jgi:hypothetical protein
LVPRRVRDADNDPRAGPWLVFEVARSNALSRDSLDAVGSALRTVADACAREEERAQVTAAVPTSANNRGRGLDWWGQLVNGKKSRAVALKSQRV